MCVVKRNGEGRSRGRRLDIRRDRQRWTARRQGGTTSDRLEVATVGRNRWRGGREGGDWKEEGGRYRGKREGGRERSEKVERGEGRQGRRRGKS